jgi:endonuclease-3 related protein
LSRTRLPSIESCVRSSGYYRQKAKKLKLFAKFVEEELGGDFGNVLTTRRPERSSSEVKDHLKKISLKKVLHSGRRTASVQDDLVSMAREKLLSLWGIGPETADTILLYGLGCPVFVVDAYTRRFLSRLTGDASWSKRPYDEARRFCESALVESTVEDLQEAHALIVRWGKDSNPGDRLVV